MLTKLYLIALVAFFLLLPHASGMWGEPLDCGGRTAAADFVLTPNSPDIYGSRRNFVVPPELLHRLSLRLKYGWFWRSETTASLTLYWDKDPIATIGPGREYPLPPNPSHSNVARLRRLHDNYVFKMNQARLAKHPLTIHFGNYVPEFAEDLFSGPVSLVISPDEIDHLKVQAIREVPIVFSTETPVPTALGSLFLELSLKKAVLARFGMNEGFAIRHKAPNDESVLTTETALRNLIAQAKRERRSLSVIFWAFRDFPNTKIFELGPAVN